MFKSFQAQYFWTPVIYKWLPE